jgi:hypothetical protein
MYTNPERSKKYNLLEKKHKIVENSPAIIDLQYGLFVNSFFGLICNLFGQNHSVIKLLAAFTQGKRAGKCN